MISVAFMLTAFRARNQHYRQTLNQYRLDQKGGYVTEQTALCGNLHGWWKER